MLTVKSAREPQWNNAEHTSLNLKVMFEETADTLGEMPFTAAPDDCEGYGRDLFARAVALEFGPVLEPSAEMLQHTTLGTLSRLKALATETINARQVELDTLRDAIQLGLATEVEAGLQPLKQAELNAWRTYRVLLSQAEGQSGFPAAIEWPEMPAEPFQLLD